MRKEGKRKKMNKKTLKGRLLKKGICLLIALAMTITLLPSMNMAVKAEDSTLTVGDCDIVVPSNVTLSEDDKAKTVTSITSGTSSLSTGWYIVDSNISTESITINGDVNIILKDGCTLTAANDYGYDFVNGKPGIRVSGDNNSLTIWGQSGGTGRINANSGSVNCAGIGGGHLEDLNQITINGGIVTASGGDCAAGIGGGGTGYGNNIIINGGIVKANGGDEIYGFGAYNIIISTSMSIKADEETNPPTTSIANDGSNLVSALNYQRYVTCTQICKVTFETNGGSNVDFQDIDYGDKVSSPTAPTKTGYTFGGWYKDSACTKAWDFDSDTVASNTTLYAKWYAHSFSWSSDYKTCKMVYTATTNSSDTKEYNCSVTSKVKTPATCTANGLTTYTATYGGESESKDVANIPAAHTLTKVAATAATTTSTGNKEYYKCSACGKLFSDSTGKTETTLDEVTIAKLEETASDEITNKEHEETASNETTITESEDTTLDEETIANNESESRDGEDNATITKPAKATNPMKLKSFSKTFKYSALKKKKATLSISFSKKAQGKVTYILSKAAKKAGIKVSAKGKVTLPKKCKKGTYKITVKAAGNSKYKAVTKTFTIKVK